VVAGDGAPCPAPDHTPATYTALSFVVDDMKTSRQRPRQRPAVDDGKWRSTRPMATMTSAMAIPDLGRGADRP